MSDADNHLHRKKHTEYIIPILSGARYAASLDVSYRVYQKEYWDFKHLQLRNVNRYGTCYAASLDVSYRVYQKEYWNFKHLQLRNVNRYGNVFINSFKRLLACQMMN
jgi:hypothetical protein